MVSARKVSLDSLTRAEWAREEAFFNLELAAGSGSRLSRKSIVGIRHRDINDVEKEIHPGLTH